MTGFCSIHQDHDPTCKICNPTEQFTQEQLREAEEQVAEKFNVLKLEGQWHLKGMMGEYPLQQWQTEWFRIAIRLQAQVNALEKMILQLGANTAEAIKSDLDKIEGLQSELTALRERVEEVYKKLDEMENDAGEDHNTQFAAGLGTAAEELRLKFPEILKAPKP